MACPVMDPYELWALGSIAPFAKPKPTKLGRKRIDRRFGKLLLVVSLIYLYLMESAHPIWQNEAKNRSNIRRPIRGIFWQNEPNSGFGLRAGYALILLCTPSNLDCKIIAGFAGDNGPKWNTS